MTSKFEVRVGTDFGHVVVIRIEQPERPWYRRPAFIVGIGAICFGAFVLVACTAYGAATGDYAPLKAVAVAGQKLLTFVTRLVVDSK